MYFTNNFVPFGAVSDFKAGNGVYTLTHDYSRNQNVPWGMIRNGAINCKKKKKFGFGIYVNGSLSGSATVYLRLWAGDRNYFDASTVVPCGVQNYLMANLKKWKARGRITRVEILIRPSRAGWTGNTSAQIFSVGIRK